MKKAFERVYDLSIQNKKIIRMRKENKSLLDIVTIINMNMKVIDEMIVLVEVIRVLIENGINVGNKEIYDVFDLLFKKEFHGGKKKYWLWLKNIKKEALLIYKLKKEENFL